MKIGLTYDLRSEYLAQGYGEEETAEFDRNDTIDALEDAIRSLGYQTFRIGSIKNLIHELDVGNSWDLVFNICEGFQGTARESQVPALLDAFGIPYTFSDPLVLALTLDKYACKSYLTKFGIIKQDFVLLQKEEQIGKHKFTYPLFVKPVAEGTGKGIWADSKIDNEAELLKQFRILAEKFKQPVLVEEFLSGREFTIAVIGNGENARILGSMEIVVKDTQQNGIYGYETKEKCETEIIYKTANDNLVNEAEKLALQAYKALNCRDVGRIDIRASSSGTPEFIEINPIPGLHPFHSDLPMIATRQGISYPELINQIIQATISRYHKLFYRKVV
ncbi:MAG: D-alanine--D-alanine ligase [Candidatus Cloacimonas sp. SDB]|nr:MAG: D-alanine--D-alanine ligase [Candidatus Cloacimonas sp. SDB]